MFRRASKEIALKCPSRRPLAPRLPRPLAPAARTVELPAAVLAETLGFLDDWRAIGRAAATCRAWALGIDDRVWRRALDYRWPGLGEVDPAVLGSNRERAREVCQALGGAWAAPKRLDGRAVTEGPVRGWQYEKRFAAAFALASTAPELDGSALSYMGRLVRENTATLRSVGFFSLDDTSAQFRRMRHQSTAGYLRDILHDMEMNTDNLDHVESADDCLEGQHISEYQLPYLLAGVPSGDWTFLFDDAAGRGIYNYSAVHPDDYPPTLPARFFAGMDKYGELESEGCFLFAFEGEPDKPESVLVYAGNC